MLSSCCPPFSNWRCVRLISLYYHCAVYLFSLILNELNKTQAIITHCLVYIIWFQFSTHLCVYKTNFTLYICTSSCRRITLSAKNHKTIKMKLVYVYVSLVKSGEFYARNFDDAVKTWFWVLYLLSGGFILR